MEQLTEEWKEKAFTRESEMNEHEQILEIMIFKNNCFTQSNIYICFVVSNKKGSLKLENK